MLTMLWHKAICTNLAGTSLCTCLCTRNIHKSYVHTKHPQKAGPFLVARLKMDLHNHNRLAYNRVHKRSQPSFCTLAPSLHHHGRAVWVNLATQVSHFRSDLIGQLGLDLFVRRVRLLPLGGCVQEQHAPEGVGRDVCYCTAAHTADALSLAACAVTAKWWLVGQHEQHQLLSGQELQRLSPCGAGSSATWWTAFVRYLPAAATSTVSKV